MPGLEQPARRRPPQYTAGAAAQIMGGQVVWGSPAAVFSGIAYDSRKVARGELFFATTGERTDGHRYLGAAIAAGATCLVVRDWSAEHLASVGAESRARTASPAPLAPGVAASLAVIRVPDTVLAVGRLAQHHRARFALPVIGVTGSVGKTTAKDMAAHVISRHVAALISEGNLNSDISLPVVLMQLDGSHEAALLEVATRGHGQLTYLGELARPTTGVITAIAPVHIETLGSVAGVASAKAELLRALPEGGLAIYPAGSAELSAELAARPLDGIVTATFGEAGSGADVFYHGAANAVDRCGESVSASLTFTVQCHPGPAADRLSLPIRQTIDARLAYPGRHNVSNAVAAALAAASLGIPFTTALAELADFAPKSAMRLDVRAHHGILIIDDAYNANLLSMTSALEVLVAGAGSGRKAAILGDMRELGPLEPETHRELGKRVAAAGLDLLICFGRAISETAAAAAAAGMAPGRIRAAATHDEAADMALAWLRQGDSLLIKGSRGLTMELIVDRIRRGWQG